MSKDKIQLCKEEGHRYGNVQTDKGIQVVCRCCGHIKSGDESLRALPTGYKRFGSKV